MGYVTYIICFTDRGRLIYLHARMYAYACMYVCMHVCMYLFIMYVCNVRVYVCLFLARQPPLGHGLLILEVSRSHKTMHRSR